MEGKVLYSFRSNCEELGSKCHKNVNKILSAMNKYPLSRNNTQDNYNNYNNYNTHKVQQNLQVYIKCCLNMEKLCNYLCDCCCNFEKISSFMINEYNNKCNKMLIVCDFLRNLSVDIGCNEIISIIKKNKLNKNKKSKKK